MPQHVTLDSRCTQDTFDFCSSTWFLLVSDTNPPNKHFDSPKQMTRQRLCASPAGTCFMKSVLRTGRRGARLMLPVKVFLLFLHIGTSNARLELLVLHVHYKLRETISIIFYYCIHIPVHIYIYTCAIHIYIYIHIQHYKRVCLSDSSPVLLFRAVGTNNAFVQSAALHANRCTRNG